MAHLSTTCLYQEKTSGPLNCHVGKHDIHDDMRKPVKNQSIKPVRWKALNKYIEYMIKSISKWMEWVPRLAKWFYNVRWDLGVGVGGKDPTREFSEPRQNHSWLTGQMLKAHYVSQIPMTNQRILEMKDLTCWDYSTSSAPSIMPGTSLILNIVLLDWWMDEMDRWMGGWMHG